MPEVLTTYNFQYNFTLTQLLLDFYYISGPAGNIAVNISENGEAPELYYTITDHLGSIVAIADEDGEILEEQRYDPWGVYRNPLTGEPEETPQLTKLFRGYTGHEMLPEFGLINMNGRLYDPVIARVLSPDNNVQNPYNPQNYNRYSYCYNNPLVYVDPSGEYTIVDDIIAATVGGVINLTVNAFQGNLSDHGFWGGVGRGFAAFGAGAVGGWGALYPEFGGWVWGGATVGATNAWLGGATSAKDIAIGAGVGAIAGAFGGATGQWAGQTLGGVVINGFNVASPVLKGAITGAIGGAAGGYTGGFAGVLIMTGDVGAANKAGINGLWSGAAVGGVVGGGAGYKYATDNKINPWTGRAHRSFTIGEGMSTDPSKGWMGVDKIADDLNSDYYKPDPSIPKEVPGYGTTSDLMYDNAVQIEIQMQENVIIYDRGPVGNGSQYYNMELGRTMNYNNIYNVKAIYNSTQTIRILIIYK